MKIKKFNESTINESIINNKAKKLIDEIETEIDNKIIDSYPEKMFHEIPPEIKTKLTDILEEYLKYVLINSYEPDPW